MLLVIYLIAVNILSFIAYRDDKKRAEKGKWRISEAALILFAVLGGALGAWAAMKLFHHKTKKKKFTITVPLFVILWCVFILFSLYQNYHIVITRYRYDLNFEDSGDISEVNETNVDIGNNNEIETDSDDKMIKDKQNEGKSSTQSLRIVQISDLHNQLFGSGQKQLLNKISKCNPDIIVVTGDVVDVTHTCYKFSEIFFQGAVEIAPTYYITGNHEKWLKGEKFDRFLDTICDMGVVYLDDKTIEKDGILIAGIADASLDGNYGPEIFEMENSDETNMENTGQKSESSTEYVEPDNTGLKILLAHEPSYHKSYEGTGADIVFTGHVHGGQVIIPGLGGLFDPDFKFFPEFYQGFHEEGGTTMYISRGLGNSLLPVRINNYPEIVVVDVTGIKNVNGDYNEKDTE